MQNTGNHYFLDFLLIDAVIISAGAEIEEYAPYLRTIAQILTENINHPLSPVREKYE